MKKLPVSSNDPGFDFEPAVGQAAAEGAASVTVVPEGVAVVAADPSVARIAARASRIGDILIAAFVFGALALAFFVIKRGGGDSDAQRAAPVVNVPETTTTTVRSRQTQIPSSSDKLAWVDSATTPSWVVQGNTPATPVPDGGLPPDNATAAQNQGSSFGHPYSPLGTPQSPGSAGSGVTAPAAVSASASALFLPRLVVRHQNGQYSLTDPGIGGKVGGNPSTDYLWAVPGQCQSRFALQSSGTTGLVYPKGAGLDGTAALVVPDAQCNTASSRAVSDRGMTVAAAQNLAQSLAQSDLSQSVGAPAFGPQELAAVVTQKSPDGLTAWGVFRRISRSTQIAPPPASPQLAFVARTTDGARWTVLWVKYTLDSSELLDVAGVYSLDAGAPPTAFYALRAPGGFRLIAVVPDGGGYKAAGVVTVP